MSEQRPGRKHIHRYTIKPPYNMISGARWKVMLYWVSCYILSYVVWRCDCTSWLWFVWDLEREPELTFLITIFRSERSCFMQHSVILLYQSVGCPLCDLWCWRVKRRPVLHSVLTFSSEWDYILTSIFLSVYFFSLSVLFVFNPPSFNLSTFDDTLRVESWDYD